MKINSLDSNGDCCPVKEFKVDSTLVALSGGEDYELLFNDRQKDPKIKGNPNLTAWGIHG